MDKRFLVTALAVCLVTVSSAALALRLEGEPQAEPLHEPVSGVEREPEVSDVGGDADYLYMIREYEGRVAVFTAQNPDEPEVVYDTLVKYLPDYDRTQMQEGIPVKDYGTLVALIEDYIS